MLYETGISYKDVGLEGLKDKIHEMSKLVKKGGLSDYVHVITCNRSQIFSTQELNGAKGTQALEQLFRIASGIDSMVIGETEILSQLKLAYGKAVKEGHCSEELGLYFKAAIKVGRIVRSKTDISVGRTSIASLAVEKVLEIEGGDPGDVLIIGSGMLAGKLAMALSNKGIKEIFLANRHYDRAKELAEKVGGRAAPLDELPNLLESAKVVFTATNAPKALIKKEWVSKRKLIIVDLSMPYDVPEELEEMENLTVIRLAAFKEIANENLAKKQEEIKKVGKIIQDELKRFQFI